MAGALELKSGDTVVEIGAGHGELTQALVTEALETNGKDGGIKVLAIEKDSELAGQAKQRFKEYSFVEVLNADVLEFFKDAGRGDTLKNNYKLTGNIPYYITGRLLRALSELAHRPELTILMIQKEVAERISANPPHMNRLAASVQFWAEPHILRIVKRGEFRPPPEVDSAVIALRSRKESAHDAAGNKAFYRTVRIIFAQPRKTLLNNLKEGFCATGMPADRAGKVAVDALNEQGIKPSARPQNLGLHEIKELARKVDKLGIRWG